jgi:hypothetical protein
MKGVVHRGKSIIESHKLSVEYTLEKALEKTMYASGYSGSQPSRVCK